MIPCTCLQVETIGDAYMVVSGAPTITKFHAIYIADMAFDMLDTMRELIDPSTDKHIQIRVGKFEYFLLQSLDV